MTAAGSSVSSVSRITICMGTLSPAPFFPAEMPSRESGPVAAAQAGAAASSQIHRAGFIEQPPGASPTSRHGSDSISAQPAGEEATSSAVSPSRTRCSVCCGPSGSRSRHSSRRPARPPHRR